MSGCTSTYSETIRRTPCIVSTFDAVDTLMCQKKSMHFVDNSTCQTPIASWSWDFGDNTVVTYTSPQPAVTHAYTEPGVYTVKLTISTEMVGGAVTATSTRPVAVNPAPKSDFTWKDVCIGATTPFTSTTNPNGSTIRDYAWKFGDPNNTAAQSAFRNPEYTYAMAGSYQVNLVTSNTIGCYDTIVKTVAIHAPPQAEFSWNNTCEGRPVYFTDNSDTASLQITTWNWYFSDEHSLLGASTSQNPTYDFSRAGIFEARLIVADKNGCGDTVVQQVAINASPVAVFTITENYDNVQGQVKISNGTINGTGYQWDFGNGFTSYETEPVIQYEKDGDYTIRLMTWNGQDCSDTTTLDYSFVFKGLYVPNAFAPDNTQTSVTLFKPSGLNLKKYYIEVLDRWGNILWESDKLDAKGSPVEGWDGTYNNNMLPAGVYLWRAKAIFKDGTYWDGHNVGDNTNMPETFTGTVTLIR
jgi:PKD repeat protein